MLAKLTYTQHIEVSAQVCHKGRHIHHTAVPHCHVLTHWGRVTHICVSKLTIMGSDNSLSHDRSQAIIWTKTGLLLIRPLGTDFIESLIEILTFTFKKMRLKVSSSKLRPFCLGLNGLTAIPVLTVHGYGQYTIVSNQTQFLPYLYC